MTAVTVVLRTHNRRDTLRGTVENLRDTAGPGVDLLVIDDGSTDGSPELLAQLEGIRWIRTEFSGAPCTFNLGFSMCDGNDVIRIDGAIRMESPGWVERLVEAARGPAGAGVVGPKILAPDGRVVTCGRRIVSPLGMRDHHAHLGWMEPDRGFDRPGPVDSVHGLVAYCRRDVIESVHGLDDTFSPQILDDDDFCMAARSKGFQVMVEPAARAVNLDGFRCDEVAEAERPAVLRDHQEYWKVKWGWDAEFPNLHHIRDLWGYSGICWRIGEQALGDRWEEEYPPADILIVTWNNARRLAEALESLRATDYPAARVWILDNGSTDGTAGLLKEVEAGGFPHPLEMVRVPVNVGLPAGMNWLLKVSRAPLVARLDDDAVVPPDWLKRLADTLREHPWAGVVAPKVVHMDRPDVIQFGDIRLWPQGRYHTNEPDRGQCDHRALVTHACGCCLVYRRKALDVAGPFDIRYSPSQQDDLDHFVALRAAGYDVLYDGGVAVRHPLTNGADLSRKARSNAAANIAKLLGKWGEDVFEVLEVGLDRAGRGDTRPRRVAERKDRAVPRAAA